MAEAGRLLDCAGQGELDLGLRLPQVHASMVGQAKPRTLFDLDKPRRRRLVSGPRVLKTTSDLLFDVLVDVYGQLGFDAIGDEVFRDLVVARIVEPTSLEDVGRVLGEFGRSAASVRTLHRTLKRCHDGRYRGQLAEICFDHAVANGDVALVLYDVTTLRTFAEKEDDFRKVGYSKIRSVDPQVVVGLLVDRFGFPLEIGCFEGNKAEKLTMLEIIGQYQGRHQIENMIVVGDAGMLSAANLAALDEARCFFIVGSRMTKAPIDLESHFHWHGDAFTDGQIIDTVTPRIGKNTDNSTSLRAEPVWTPDTHQGSWRAIWAFSRKRYARDNRTLTAQLGRAQAVIAGEKAARTPRFVKATKSGLALDQAALDRARRLAGLKGWVTNIPATLMPAAEIMSNYHDLWHVEQSFRISKSDLNATPLFARKRDAIEAHLTIVFTALAISRTIQNQTGLSIRAFLRTLRPLRSATIQVNGIIQAFPPEIPSDVTATLKRLQTGQARH